MSDVRYKIFISLIVLLAVSLNSCSGIKKELPLNTRLEASPRSAALGSDIDLKLHIYNFQKSDSISIDAFHEEKFLEIRGPKRILVDTLLLKNSLSGKQTIPPSDSLTFTATWNYSQINKPKPVLGKHKVFSHLTFRKKVIRDTTTFYLVD